MKKMFSLALALIMALALCVPAMAQEAAPTTPDTEDASITITNAAKGETYAVYKLFDATVTGATDGSIAYTGEIPESLDGFFVADTAGNVFLKEGVVIDKTMTDALAAWTKGATAVVSVVSDGSALTFTGLPYGYYVITTTQGAGSISVDSTNPNAQIVDKNQTTPNGVTKSVDDADVNIGDTVTYTVSFATSNYDGAGTAATQITSYTIEDTLPEFLTNVTVTSIIVDNDGKEETTDDQTSLTVKQFENKKITIDWTDGNGKSLYKNGAKVILTYTAVVDDDAAIDGEGNTNKVTVSYNDKELPSDEETIYTYAIALKKVNDKGENLAGATFQFPFYVKAEPAADGAYIYAGTTAPAEGDTSIINTLTTPASGEIVIKGVESGTYSVTETVAPNGYNKLTAPFSVTAAKIGATTTEKTFYLDENGVLTEKETSTVVTYNNANLAATVQVVVNMTGSELPSTGGIGTTIFYTVGGLMMAAAVVLFITKKKLVVEE